MQNISVKYSKIICKNTISFPTAAPITNIALGKPCTQANTLDYNGYLWNAGFAVDGCGIPEILLNHGGDVDASQCCSCCFGGFPEERWSVDLLATYFITSIVVIGRYGKCVNAFFVCFFFGCFLGFFYKWACPPFYTFRPQRKILFLNLPLCFAEN